MKPMRQAEQDFLKELNKSKFLIENLIFLATPEFQLENQIKISLPELLIVMPTSIF